MTSLYKGVLILGSATPSLESYYLAQTGKYVLLEMKNRIDKKPMPHIVPVDMREELHFGNRKILSRSLQKLLQETLARKEQSIIMLNRRGYATFVMCRSCGEVIHCPKCDLPMVYHREQYLACHRCDITQPVPKQCPKCSSKMIKFFGSGTEKLEQELEELYPDARVIRLDRDTTKRKMAHIDILHAFRDRKYDILLGTQMVAKGHDIPNVTAVGIISADSVLHLPNFRSPERCFALITQTAGRAGRGVKQGEVIIQSYNPQHYAVQYGIKQDYSGFYEAELPLRKENFYPPFAQLIQLMVQNKEEEIAYKRAKEIKQLFSAEFTSNNDYQLLGPAPAIIAKLNDIYRFVILLKGKDMRPLQDFLKRHKLHIEDGISINVNPF